MANEQIFKAFADRLQHGLGPPKGRTDKEVEDALREQYVEVFSAMEQLNKAANYQDPALNLEESIIKVDVAHFLVKVGFAVVTDRDRTGLAFRLTREEIITDNPYLIAAAGGTLDRWPADRQGDFILALSKAVLNVLGC